MEDDRSDIAAGNVSGWLLLLCLVLVVFYPATELYSVLVRVVPKALATHNGKLTVLLVVYSIAFTTLAMFSFSAGIRLWRVRSGAVTFAKRYLLAYLTTNVAYFLFWAFMNRPNNTESLAEMGWYHVVGPIASFVLWYTYLENSRRVKETYRD